jgi:hypothetical protein
LRAAPSWEAPVSDELEPLDSEHAIAVVRARCGDLVADFLVDFFMRAYDTAIELEGRLVMLETQLEAASMILPHWGGRNRIARCHRPAERCTYNQLSLR